MFDAIYGILKSIVNFVAEKLGLDFRLGESEAEKKERELNEIQEKKVQLEKKEKKLKEDLEAGDYNVIQAEKKLAKVEQEYQEYLDMLADGGFTGQQSKITRFERDIRFAEENLAKQQAKVQEKINAIEEEKKKLLFAEKSALFDVKDFVSGSMTGNPSGNGAASAINENLLADYMRGYANEGTAYIDQSDKKTIIKNENNNYGGNQRVEPVSRYGYNFDNINFAAGAYGG